MAQFDYGGGCPCGLHRTCIEQCEHYVAPGTVVPLDGWPAKPKVVWVVGREYGPTNRMMFFWEEEEAKRVCRGINKVGDADGNELRLRVWSVEVE